MGEPTTQILAVMCAQLDLYSCRLTFVETIEALLNFSARQPSSLENNSKVGVTTQHLVTCEWYISRPAFEPDEIRCPLL